MRYKDHILRAMNTDVEHLNLEENMLMNRTRCLILGNYIQSYSLTLVKI